MAEQPDSAERTEAATPRRLEQARQQGQVALSREAVGFATLGAASIVAALVLPIAGRELIAAAAGLLTLAAEAHDVASVAAGLVRPALVVVLPVAAAAATAAVLATIAQTGPLLRLEALAPDLSRLDPIAASKRLLGPQALLELLRTLAKFALVGVALRYAAEPERWAAALAFPPGLLLEEAGRATFRLIAAALGVYALIAALDIAHARWKHARELRMSREELREEAKESEGDPRIKARLRRIRESRARVRMLAAVPKAAVVVTNPTHYAAALAYEHGSSAAPRLVAKGMDSMAARIRAAAEEHGIPIVANPPLARALYRLEPDSEVPPEHWQAVANIIAYVWGLRQRPHDA